MKPYWEEEAFRTWNTYEWWKKVLLKSDNFEMKKIQEMDCFEVAWNDWLGTDNRFAVGDRPTIEKDNGRYMNLISIIGNKK